MGFILKNKKYHLKKADYSEETGSYINPGRGWYHIYTFMLGEIKEEELKYLPFEEGEYIALVLINISRYSGVQIDREGILSAKNILSVFAEKGKEVILRIIYDNEGKGMEKEPSLFSVILGHMRQLGEVVKKYEKHIMLTQGLFVGSWGEMHSSKFLSKKQLGELSETWKSASGGARMAFRRPVQCRLAQKGEKYEIGIFDDAIFASENHLGTFGQEPRSSAGWEKPWCMEEETAYIRQTAKMIPCGGEAVAGQELSPEETLQVLKGMNISYLNSIYDEKILNRWKGQQWEGVCLYDYIGNHLGYRFVVRDVMLNGRKRYLSLVLENTGFASIYDRADIRLTAQKEPEAPGEKKKNIMSVSYDIRTLQPGEKKEIKIELEDEFEKELKKGDRLFLEITRNKDKKSIRFANQAAGERMLLGEIE